MQLQSHVLSGKLFPLFLRITHHTIRKSVTGLRHRQALDDFWRHPGKCANQGHVCRVGQELRRPKITNLRR